MRFFTPHEAKEFFIQKIETEATAQQIDISENEKKLLCFSFEDANADLDTMDDFDKSASDAFEEKMTYLLQSAIQHDGGLTPMEDPYKQAREALDKEDHYINVIIDRALKEKPKPSARKDANYWKKHPIRCTKKADKYSLWVKLSALCYGLLSGVFATLVLVVALAAIFGRVQFHFSTNLLVPLALSLLAISVALLGISTAFFITVFHFKKHEDRLRYIQGRLRYLSVLILAGGIWALCTVSTIDRYLTGEVVTASVDEIQKAEGRCYKPWYLWLIVGRNNRAKPCFEFQAIVSLKSVAGPHTNVIDAGSCYLDEGSACKPLYKQDDQVPVRYYRGTLETDTFINNWGLLTFASIAGILFILLIPLLQVLKDPVVTKEAHANNESIEADL